MHRRATLTTSIALALAGMAATPGAIAVQLGELEGASRLGQAFEGRIPLVLSVGEIAGEQAFSIQADAVSLADPYQRQYLEGMTLEVVTGAGGRAYLVVRNPQPLDVPLLSFRLRVDTGTVAVVRSFALMPDLQMAGPGRPASASPRRPVRDFADADAGANTDANGIPSPVRPATSPAAGGMAAPPAVMSPVPGSPYRVETGETLSAIALAVGREIGRPWREVMQQIHRDNPEAFIGGDIDRLMAGKTLMLPAALEPTSPDGAASTSRIADTVKPTPSPTRPTPGPERVALAGAAAGTRETATTTPTVDTPNVADAPDPTTSGSVANTAITRASLERDAVALVRDLLAEVDAELAQNPDAVADPEITALLAESAALYAQIRARYETQVAIQPSEPLLATPQPRDAPTAAATAQEGSEIDRSLPVLDEDVQLEIAAVGQGTAAVTPTVRTAPADAPRTPDAAGGALIQPGDDAVEASIIGVVLRYLVPLIFTLGAIGGVWGWQRWRRGIAVAATQSLTATRAGTIDPAEAERRAHVAAKARERMMSEQRGEILVETNDAEVEEFDTTADLVTVALANIDDSIAHGRYQRAEQDLLAVLRRAPHNVHALMRLLDVYYITENTVEFQAVAERIHSTHRADVPEEEWNRLLRMGKVLCPWHPLFGGPSLVEGKKA